MPKPAAAASPVTITKLTLSGVSSAKDVVSTEEPLQITVDGRPLAVAMRTPGADADLVMGFLKTEGIISRADEVEAIELDGRENEALVFLKDGVEVDWGRLTRYLFTASSCGLCGKASIEAVRQTHQALPAERKAPSFDLLVTLPSKLRDAQKEFERTGGLHGAGLFSLEGELLCLREDVGRHNALDKVIGAALTSGVDFSNAVLLLSGRVSFELMQKALAAGIPTIAGISAPSSLAVTFAKESGQTLVGFLRGNEANLYAGELG